MTTLQERVRHARQRAGFTQKQLEHASGVPQNTISRIETGSAQDVSSRTLRALATALNVSTDYLLGLRDTFEHHGETDSSQ